MNARKLFLAAVAALALSGCDAGTSCVKGVDALQSTLSKMAEAPVIDRVSGPAVAAQNLVQQAQFSRNARDYDACSAKVQKARRCTGDRPWSRSAWRWASVA